MTMTQQAEQRKAERRRLVIAARRLKDNEDWKLLRAKLFALAEPFGTCFKQGSDFNSHQAAFNDGAQSLTRYLMNLELSEPDEEGEKREAVAEFRGE